MRVESIQPLLADAFEESQEMFIAYVTLQRQPYLARIGSVVVGQRFAVQDALPNHPVHTLTGTLHEPKPGERLRDPAVPRRLLVEDVLRRDSGRKAARTDDLQTPRVLPHEDRTGMAVVPMADSIQECFADAGFDERRHGVLDHAVLVVLQVVSQIHEFPQPVIEEQEALPEFLALVGWARPRRRPVLENHLGLRKWRPSPGRVPSKINAA